jgi:hypothetical protein
MRGLFGDAVIDKTSIVWGVDEEGELNGCYCASGHPGVSNNSSTSKYPPSLNCILQLWYAAGDFGISRFYSKQLVRFTSASNSFQHSTISLGTPNQGH